MEILGKIYFTFIEVSFGLTSVICKTKMTDEEKLEFYKSEYQGAAFAEFIAFRCSKNLGTWLKIKAMEEGRDISQILRRLLTKSAKEEGFDPNGIL